MPFLFILFYLTASFQLFRKCCGSFFILGGNDADVVEEEDDDYDDDDDDDEVMAVRRQVQLSLMVNASLAAFCCLFLIYISMLPAWSLSGFDAKFCAEFLK